MLQNYIRIAFRTLTKNKVYSSINILGFSIGITCAVLILLWVHDELTYDSWMPKYDRIYRVMVKANYDGKINMWNANPIPALAAIKEEDPNIANTAISDWGNDHLLSSGTSTNRSGIKRAGNYVSQSFLEIFEYPIITGTREGALEDMKSIVLTQSTAKALFGNEDAIDKIVRLDDAEELKVTAVIKDVPPNSNIKFDFLLSWKLYEQIWWVKKNSDRWDNWGSPIYVELKDPSKKEEVESKIADLPARHGQNDFKKEFALYPISRWRLYSQFENGQESGGLIVYVKTFAVIAGLVLFIACVNFMNLATARAEKRAVEVGVRKSVGSRRSDLVKQFIWESILTTAIAFVVGLIFAQLALPFYNQLVSKQLSIPYLSPVFIGGSVLMITVVGVLAGSYPAFYLSAFKPISVLKGGRGTIRGGSIPRKVLVTLQFGLSMILILATIVVYQQIEHVRDRDMGYQPDNMLIVNASNDIKKNYAAIKTALLESGVVESVTKSNTAITEWNSWSPVDWPGKPADHVYYVAVLATEYDYVKTMGLKLLEGRDFSEEFKSDSTAVIVNRAAVDLMGLKDPIGSKIKVFNGVESEIVGVIDNTISGSPYDASGAAAVVGFAPDWVSAVTIRLAPGNSLPGTLKKIETIFKTYSPSYPFDFKFADDAFQQKFTQINLTSRLASIFAALTMIITGLGLFGLASFIAAQRTKEMGIRKVMGASVTQLLRLITTDFSVLVVIAFVIASPAAWWLLNQYLEQYQYRIEVQWWIFPATGAVALIFALIIVSSQALRAARTNPAQSLRSE
ncbi:MAG: ABC transporter permease [Bacteroidota bacterium]